MQQGATAAAINSAITAALSITAIYLHHPVTGLDGWGLLDALVFAVVAWRMYRLSLGWAIAGLLFFAYGQIDVTIHTHRSAASFIIAAGFLLYYIHAVRGGLFLRKSTRTPTEIATQE
jgi:hypothetical protein